MFITPRRCLLLLGITFIFALPATGASASAGEPRTAVESLIDDLRSYQRSGGEQSAQKVHAHLDVEGVAARSLGETWNSLSPGERRSFVELFRRLLASAAYPRAADAFDPKYELELRPAGEEGGRHRVAAEVSHPEEGRIGLVFHLEQRDGAWIVVDVVVDGVSMAENLRSQMQAIVNEHSYQELVRRMQEKLEE